jgi:hypothetical protein
MGEIKQGLLLVVCVLGSLTFCPGCEEGSQPRPPSEKPKQKEKQREQEGSSYVGELHRGLKKGQEKPRLLALRNELKQFRALKGRCPKSLEEFTEWRNASLPELPPGRKFQYDSNSGKIQIVNTK